MREKIFALTSVLTLLLTTGIAAAGGPDGTIDTYFYADGLGPSFGSALQLDDGDTMIERVSIELWGIPALGFGDMTVVENIDLEDHSGGWCSPGYTDANIDKFITVNPGSAFFGLIQSTAVVQKEVAWDGLGEVYRYADLDGTVSVVDASTLLGDAHFIDNIEYNDNVFVYESVGLNRFATCEDPVRPPQVPMPVCSWC